MFPGINIWTFSQFLLKRDHLLLSSRLLPFAGFDRPPSKDRLCWKSPNVHSAGRFQIENWEEKSERAIVSPQAELYFQLVADYKARAAKVKTSTNLFEF